MTLEQLYFASGIIAAIGVIGSLIYLAAQIRQNTISVRMSTGQAITEDLRTLYRYSAQSDSAEVVYSGFQDLAKLGGSDRMRFFAMMHDYFFAFQNAFFQMSSGTLDKRYWTIAVNSLQHLATFPGVRSYWTERKFYYSEEFRAFLEREVFAVSPEPQFSLAGTEFDRPVADV